MYSRSRFFAETEHVKILISRHYLSEQMFFLNERGFLWYSYIAWKCQAQPEEALIAFDIQKFSIRVFYPLKLHIVKVSYTLG